LSRRTVIVGAMVAGIAGTGLALRLRQWRTPSPEARALLDQARLLLYQNTRESQNQAIGLCREAVRAAPRFPDAWGYLGYTCATASHVRAQAEADMLRQQATVAGQNALDIEPGNALGELALADALPLLGANNWLPRDHGIRRALARRPDDADILFALAYYLRFSGHVAEAAALCARIEPRQRSPVCYNVWSRSLWSAGRTDEALETLQKGAAIYPSQRTLWQTRIEVLMFSGRVDEAVGVAQDERARPANADARELARIEALASALQAGGGEGSDRFMREQRQAARTGDREAVNAIRFASISGHLDDAFAIAEAYFFSRGFAVGESMGNGQFSLLDQRRTNFLFEPPTAPMRVDPRFGALTEELGLERFWRESRRPPDYRRVSSTVAA
jgi:tetratricopeptide (TPR) repeat protein